MLRNSKWIFDTFMIRSNRTYAKKARKSKAAEPALPKPQNELEFVYTSEINPNFLATTIGATTHKWMNVLKKYPELKTVKRKDIMSSANSLKACNFDVEDILAKPMVLYNSALTLENRHNVLMECGIDPISISLLFKYITVINKPVAVLKSQGYIPHQVSVVERLIKGFAGVELDASTADNANVENMELKALRQEILNSYLRKRLDMTDADIEKVWKVYPRVRHKSFKSIQDMVNVLLDELHFPKDRVNKNAYLLYGDYDNVRRIMTEVPTIDGHDMREIAYRRPKILMSSCDGLLKTLKYVKSFGIKEGAVLRCLEILTLSPETVLERLRDLNEIEEFKVLCSNPRILRLVHYQNKARLRLEYLNQLKVRCASLHILSCDSEAFAKFARDGSDRTKGRDIVVFLSNIMGKEENDVRNLLSRHPNWCHIPAIQVKQCYDYLLSKKFLVDDIYQNIHLLLYPIKRIEEKLHQIMTPEYFENMQLDVSQVQYLSNSEILTLILYSIESEFHFTGDGIWTDQHTQQVENFNNLLPDFPQGTPKVYKFGTKPAGQRGAQPIEMQNV